MTTKTEFHDDDLLYSPQFDDHYYSRHDGRAECAHVFIAGNGLAERWLAAEHFAIGELGFGTGLNFLETWRHWKQVRAHGQALSFHSIEAHPLTDAVARRALSRWPELGTEIDQLLDHWNEVGAGVNLDDQTYLHVHTGEANDVIGEFPQIDAWYLDGFSPAKNPDMWSSDLMEMVGQQTVSQGTFASYTAAGWVRRNLDAAGFAVEKAQGFGTKRDMIKGVKR